MGIVKKPSYTMYWSTDHTIQTPIFAECMSLRRIQIILQFLHFVDADEGSIDKIRKVRPVLEYLVERFQEIYRPGRDISIDETLLRFKGRLSLKQCNLSKRARFGIKLYKTCESVTGYVYNCTIYTGKDESKSKTKSTIGVSGATAKEMLGDLAKQGRNLHIDNWYTFPLLLKQLVDEKTNACGTVRMNRKYLPEVNTKQMKLGDMKVFHTPKLCLILWKDKKVVSMLTTYQRPLMITTNKLNHRTGEQKKPNVVMSYNKNLGGVDLSDQVLQPYEVLRKTMKWYHKVFFHLLDIAIYNAFVVHNSLHSEKKIKKNQLDFRLALVKELLEKHCKKNADAHRTCSQPSSRVKQKGNIGTFSKQSDESIRKSD